MDPSERVDNAPAIILNHGLLKIYFETVSLLGPVHAKSLGLHTIIVATFFRELAHYIRYMVGLKPAPELHQGVHKLNAIDPPTVQIT
ncbi:hypothetical protein BDZ89DRAFT_1064975 [Hymenopellis radicata]|nr:hypothetical protein BDZ89DRAFT_1064975 [Hymenopellis radicata]